MKSKITYHHNKLQAWGPDRLTMKDQKVEGSMLVEDQNLSILIKVSQIKFKLLRAKEKSNVSIDTERIHIDS